MVQRVVGRAAAALLALALLAGCDTDCRLACRHMMDDCGIERPDTTIEDCTAQCTALQWADWEKN